MRNFVGKVGKGLLATSLAMGAVYAVPEYDPVYAQAAASDYQGHVYQEAIDYVIKNRLMWLYGDGKFYPDAYVTQADLIASMVALERPQTRVQVPELPDGHWAKTSYELARGAGYLNGIEVKPGKQLTREEFAQIVANAWGKYRSRYNSPLNQYKIQALVDRGVLPAKSGQFPNGVSTSKYDGITGVTRAEQAGALMFLHKDYQGIMLGENLANMFHNSLKISGGYITGQVPSYSGIDVILYVLDNHGNTHTYTGEGVRLKIDQITLMQLSVRPKDSAYIYSKYEYTSLPSLDRVSGR